VTSGLAATLFDAYARELLDHESVAEGEQKPSAPDSACPLPGWQRAPVRVTFEFAGGTTQTFAIRGHALDLLAEEQQDEEAAK
jgi:hypothetical protein